MDITLDWKSIAGTIAPLAPKLGAVLGTGVGGPVGGIIGGLAGNALASIFGTDPTPEAVGKAIAQDPDAADKIRDLEETRGQEILAQAQVHIEALKQQTAQFQTQADDTDRARQFNVRLGEMNSPLSWGASILATVFTAAFFVILAIVLTHDVKENQILLVLLGTLTAGEVQILSYFFGSSAGSKNSSDRFANLASQVASQPNPSPAVVSAVKAATGKRSSATRERKSGA